MLVFNWLTFVWSWRRADQTQCAPVFGWLAAPLHSPIFDLLGKYSLVAETWGGWTDDLRYLSRDSVCHVTFFFLSWLGFVFCPLYILYISTCRYLICIIYSIFFLYLFNTSTPHLLIHFIVIFHPPFTMLLVIVFVPVDFLEWGTGPALGGFDYQHFIRMHSYISNIWIPFHLKSTWCLKRLVYHVHFASLFRLLLGRVYRN